MVRWPGLIKPGTVSNEIVHHIDWLPIFVQTAGAKDTKKCLMKGGVKSIGRPYKVYLDGHSLLPYFKGDSKEIAERHEIFYFSDDGDLTALRYEDWKAIFMEQRVNGTLKVWTEPFIPLREPFIFNLRRDPFEQAQITSNSYYDWMIDRVYLLVSARAYVGRFLETFNEFPPRQKAPSFSVDQAMDKLKDSFNH